MRRFRSPLTVRSTFVLVLPATVFLVTAILATVSAWGEDLGPKAYRPTGMATDQAQLGPISGPTTSRPEGLDVATWVDRADATYAPGEPLTLFIKPNRDAYVTVLDIATSGKVKLLFPNAAQPDSRVEAHRVLRIGGVETIRIIASERPLDLIPYAESDAAGPFRILRATGKTIAERIRAQIADTTAGSVTTRLSIIRILPRAKKAI
jgi:hypothetical protein